THESPLCVRPTQALGLQDAVSAIPPLTVLPALISLLFSSQSEKLQPQVTDTSSATTSGGWISLDKRSANSAGHTYQPVGMYWHCERSGHPFRFADSSPRRGNAGDPHKGLFGDHRGRHLLRSRTDQGRVLPSLREQGRSRGRNGRALFSDGGAAL